MHTAQGQDSVWKTLLHDKRTQRFAALLDEFPDLVSQLDDSRSAQRWTLWVPCDQAMQHAKFELNLSSSENKRRFLEHLISPYEFPATELFYFPNVPLVHRPRCLNGRQLLRIRPHFRYDIGPSYSVGFDDAYIQATDITSRNGRMHLLSDVPPQPRSVSRILQDLPAVAFGLLRLAIDVSGFSQDLEDLLGSTMFAPTDSAFHECRLDASTMASMDPGVLRELLRCHIAPGRTLYSNMRYDVDPKPEPPSLPDPLPRPSGHQTVRLDSAVSSKPIRIDIGRIKGLIDMWVNCESQVVSMDHMAADGVVHIVDRLIVPTGQGMGANSTISA